tara:strand:- start:2780 stop:2974 length:195 start_codon:yes stop_codon:yes gene_type:complete
MKKLYKVQSHNERGWKDVSDWITSLTEAKEITSNTTNRMKDHLRIIEKTMTTPHHSSIKMVYTK